MKTIIVLTSNFFKSCILFYFFFDHVVHQFFIHNEKSFIEKRVFILCYTFFSQKTVNNSSFVFSSLSNNGFRKNEDTVVQIRPLESSKYKSKQTFCDSAVLVSKWVYLYWSSSSVFTMSHFNNLVKACKNRALAVLGKSILRWNKKQTKCGDSSWKPSCRMETCRQQKRYL